MERARPDARLDRGDLETLLERQGEMLEAIQDLAGALDVWVSTSQTILERYLPQLVRLLVNERS